MILSWNTIAVHASFDLQLHVCCLDTQIRLGTALISLSANQQVPVALL